jgi:hypothetical protein
MWVRLEEGFGGYDCCGCSVGSGTALQFGEGVVDQGGRLDLGEGIGGAELGIRVLGRVEVIDSRDFSEVRGRCTISV